MKHCKFQTQHQKVALSGPGSRAPPGPHGWVQQKEPGPKTGPPTATNTFGECWTGTLSVLRWGQAQAALCCSWGWTATWLSQNGTWDSEWEALGEPIEDYKAQWYPQGPGTSSQRKSVIMWNISFLNAFSVPDLLGRWVLISQDTCQKMTPWNLHIAMFIFPLACLLETALSCYTSDSETKEVQLVQLEMKASLKGWIMQVVLGHRETCFSPSSYRSADYPLSETIAQSDSGTT